MTKLTPIKPKQAVVVSNEDTKSEKKNEKLNDYQIPGLTYKYKGNIQGRNELLKTGAKLAVLLPPGVIAGESVMQDFREHTYDTITDPLKTPQEARNNGLNLVGNMIWKIGLTGLGSIGFLKATEKIGENATKRKTAKLFDAPLGKENAETTVTTKGNKKIETKTYLETHISDKQRLHYNISDIQAADRKVEEKIVYDKNGNPKRHVIKRYEKIDKGRLSSKEVGK